MIASYNGIKQENATGHKRAVFAGNNEACLDTCNDRLELLPPEMSDESAVMAQSTTLSFATDSNVGTPLDQVLSDKTGTWNMNDAAFHLLPWLDEAVPSSGDPVSAQFESGAQQRSSAMYRRRQSFAYQQDIYATPIKPEEEKSAQHQRIPTHSRDANLSYLNINLTLGIEGKPYSYAQLISYAIAHSANGRLTLSEIYDWCLEHFPYFKEQTNTGWKNSIRHNLSLNKLFVKEPRPLNEPGKGAYWCLNEEKMQADATLIATQNRKRSHSALEPPRYSSRERVAKVKGRMRSNSDSLYSTRSHLQSMPDFCMMPMDMSTPRIHKTGGMLFSDLAMQSTAAMQHDPAMSFRRPDEGLSWKGACPIMPGIESGNIHSRAYAASELQADEPVFHEEVCREPLFASPCTQQPNPSDTWTQMQQILEPFDSFWQETLQSLDSTSAPMPDSGLLPEPECFPVSTTPDHWTRDFASHMFSEQCIV